MAESKVKVQTFAGLVDGVAVQVEESTERWSDITLEDGTILKIKASVMSAIRPDDQFDPSGNPLYVLSIAPTIIIVSVRDELKKQVN
jgi:hypothetical protein